MQKNTQLTKSQVKKAIWIEPSKIENNRVFLTEWETFWLGDLIEVQKKSFETFVKTWIDELIDEITPITDFSWKRLELKFLNYRIEDTKFTPAQAKKRNTSYDAVIKTRVQLINKETWEIKEQDVLLGSIPMMTDKWTFIVNWIERVVVNQLVRSPWAFFAWSQTVPWKFNVKIIPKRWVWLEIETDKKWVLYAKIDRKRKFPVTQLFRVFGYDDKQIIKEFWIKWLWVESDYIHQTLEKDNARSLAESCQSVYRKIRPWDLATVDNAKTFLEQTFFDFTKYDMWVIARYKTNKRFWYKKDDWKESRVFQVDEFASIIKELIRLNHEWGKQDDIDHLSNRRVRSVGELISAKFRVWLMRMERIIKDRMTVLEPDQLAPMQLVNARPVTASLREFFVWSQLSQFMDQTNPLSELAHKRRLSAMWPWGLSRDRASFEVRDVHPSHYGRVCPITTPEWPNIWLVLHFATYWKVNDYWFIETPFRTINNTVKNWKSAIWKILRVETNWVKEWTKIDETILKKIEEKNIEVNSYLTEEVKYYDADEEKSLVIAQANSLVDEDWNFTSKQIAVRKAWEPLFVHEEEVTHMDISPKQIISESTALIPFLEHDDNTRASMGSNMLRQAVSLAHPESPIVWTWLEWVVADWMWQVFSAKENWKVIYADAKRIEVMYETWEKEEFDLNNYARTNQWTSYNTISKVVSWQEIKKWDILWDWAAVQDWELALWRNLLVAYMTWKGYNFEDAIIVSDRVTTDSLFDSIHVKEYVVDIRDTKLWAEQMTRDIPNVWDAKLKDLDSEWIIRIWATVKEWDILVWKITPKWETEQTPEERLLQAIFWEKAKDVKDTSLRLWGWEWWKVVDVQILSKKEWDELQVWVIKQIRVFVGQIRTLQVWDKMAWRHWNKWVIAKIVPREDMPFLEDWTPVDIILNPLWVSSRMNIWQVLETHLWWASKILWIKIATPALNWIKPDTIQKIMKKAWLPEDWKLQLFDWMTWEPFAHKTTVWIKYMLKLHHLVEDKIHARSVWPYSLVTQQPLWGKAQHWGQRFWEMEVWALEWYWAAHTLQEMITIKSDDVLWRARAYEDIVKWVKIRKPSVPESFNVLVHELQALCLNVDLMNTNEESVEDAVHVSIKTLEEKAVKDDESLVLSEDDKISDLNKPSWESEEMIEEEFSKWGLEWEWWATMEEEVKEELESKES